MLAPDGVAILCIIWTAVFAVCSCAATCPMDSCSLPDSNNQCKDLDEYRKCMKSLMKKCRGDISYHSALTVSNAKFKRYCEEDVSKYNSSEHSQSMIPSPTNELTCPFLFDDKKEHTFCGLFGDPHLRTFDGRYQTCRVRGAWQVIENPFFTIMVTNEAVLNSSTATAPTKLTVLLKAHNPECTSQKLYEAQGGIELPKSFGDGSTLFGPVSSPTVSLSWRQNDPSCETVIIRLSYISTLITVTRVGKYLSVYAKLPDQLAQTFNQDRNELCSNGCPVSEQIDIAKVPTVGLDRALTLCHNSVGPSGHRLTDQYLDWCVFDMMASQDEQFINASHAAYSDVLLFEPRSLFNRTISVYEFNPVSTAVASCVDKLNLFIIIVVTLYNFLSVPNVVQVRT